jgi:predicted RNA binding protein YcfA (HicA-like mRNA interferase family)
MNGKQVLKILKNNGWQVVRVRGSHHMVSKDSVSFPVPVHGTEDIGIGLLRKIEKLSGVKLK